MIRVLICFEDVFPGLARDLADGDAKFLVVITNDAWFHDTAGPYQHLDSARFRAIEENMPLVRVANNGISAVVDAHGRILKRIPYGQTGVVDVI